jgi:hypothetical protein
MSGIDTSPASVIVDPFSGQPLITQATFDAFGNLRVSNPQTVFDSKQVYDADLLNFFSVPTAGGTLTYSQQRSSTILAVTGAAGDAAVRQTKRYFNYQPGKGIRVDATFVLRTGDDDVEKEVGLFDLTNGIFLQQVGSQLAIVRRSDVSGVVVDEVVLQNDWSDDTFDGFGPSGATFDPTMCQVMRIDAEWLGGGPVRVGFMVPDKGFVYANTFQNANLLDSVYMRTPNLPVRYSIRRTGAGAGVTMEAICCTVVSEGGQQVLGNVWAADRDVTARAVTAATLLPLIAIRLRGPGSTVPATATNLRRTVQLLGYTIASLAAGDTSRYRLLLNPTRGAGTAPTWVARDALSSVEYDITSTQALTGGFIIDAGYAQGRSAFAGTATQQARPGADFAGTVADELVLAAQAQTGTNNLLASMQWVEL